MFTFIISANNFVRQKNFDIGNKKWSWTKKTIICLPISSLATKLTQMVSWKDPQILSHRNKGPANAPANTPANGPVTLYKLVGLTCENWKLTVNIKTLKILMEKLFWQITANSNQTLSLLTFCMTQTRVILTAWLDYAVERICFQMTFYSTHIHYAMMIIWEIEKELK